MSNLFDYDDRYTESIVNYAKQLKGKSFRDVENEFNKSSMKEYFNFYEDSEINYVSESGFEYVIDDASKGNLGNLLERCYFGYKPNSRQGADFPKAELELKTTPVDLKKNGEEVAGERLSITNISYKEPVIEDFYLSHVWNKIKNMLIVSYLRDKSIPKDDYIIKYVYLYNPSKEDLKIIIDDYNKINEKLKLGLAHEIHENDTNYLGACTKGSDAKNSIKEQYYGNHIPAPKRNFCFRKPYMDFILHEYVIKDYKKEESILENVIDSSMPFDDLVISKIQAFFGKSDQELCTLFNLPFTNNKAQWSSICFRILGIRNNQADEFKKAGIVVKTIRVEEDGSVNEHWELPTITFKELASEEWEDSTLNNYLSNTKFLIVVFKRNKNHYFLKGSTFFSFSENTLNNEIRADWQSYVDEIKKGVHFEIHGKRVFNSLPNPSKTNVIHMRPHTNLSAYKFDNYERGNLKSDGDELPNGDIMTKQSFWINEPYFTKTIINKMSDL